MNYTYAESAAPTSGYTPRTETRAPETTILIRAFNEERWLPEVLDAIEKQKYRDFEVLLVDSGSVDRTREIVASRGGRVVRLRSDDFTFGHALNVGIREARGSLIVILSAHAIPTSDSWLERLIEPLRQSNTAMVFGAQRGHSLSKFSEARDFERVFPSKPQLMDDDHVFVNNANSAIKRELWELHPFDEGLPGLEDAEWAKYWIPLGKDVWYEPDASIFHVHTESWPQVRHRFYREGIAGRWTTVR
ncbi:MAG TPA: glycosyltransferase family A protein, partial [Terriglobales bacterium]|nr:glycosyltransferase family A protein [Terriglobales bacterium]